MPRIALHMASTARVTRIAWLGCALIGVVGAVVACQDTDSADALPNVDSGIAPVPTPPTDAAPSDSAVPPPPVEDASTDADASQVVVVADLADDYSKTSNPNGAWTFGYTPGVPGSDAGALVVFSTATDTTGVTAWFDPTNAVLSAPTIFLNDTSAAINGAEPGEVALHPGQSGEYAVAQWTAPAAGTYAVEVQFKAGDTGDTNGLLLHNGAVLVNEDSTSTNTVHTLDVVLSAGDTLSVAVGYKGDFLFDTTPVIFTIRTSSP